MIKKIIHISIFLSLILILNGENKNTPSGAILVLGDSLTAGFGINQEQAYPHLVKKQLANSGHSLKVINAGISGNTTAGGLRRIDWYFSNSKIDIMILALGANDGLRGFPLQKTEENLQKIIDQARVKNPQIKIILAGMKIPPNMGEEYCKKFEAMFPTLAKKNKCDLIPFLLQGVAGLKEFNLPDGIHPNVEGHKKIAENVITVLKSTLKEKK